jgi:hypothetical protein
MTVVHMKGGMETLVPILIGDTYAVLVAKCFEHCNILEI